MNLNKHCIVDARKHMMGEVSGVPKKKTIVAILVFGPLWYSVQSTYNALMYTTMYNIYNVNVDNVVNYNWICHKNRGKPIFQLKFKKNYLFFI
jgi:hypothetical protein